MDTYDYLKKENHDRFVLILFRLVSIIVVVETSPSKLTKTVKLYDDLDTDFAKIDSVNNRWRLRLSEQTFGIKITK